MCRVGLLDPALTLFSGKKALEELWYDAAVAISVINFIGGSILALPGWSGPMAVSRRAMDPLQAN
jgi:hypothetical protein